MGSGPRRVRRGLAGFACAAAVLGALAVSAADGVAQSTAPAPGDGVQGWIATLVSDQRSSDRAAAIAGQHGVQLVHTFTNALNGFSFVGTSAAASALEHNPQVARVEPDRPVHAVETAPNGILRIDAWAAHEAGYRGRTADGTPVRVAVIDTGIDLDHPDLQANISPGEGINCVTPGAPANDDHGHGTHVAGSAAAAYNGQGVVGVATDVRLVPIKVLNASGSGSDAQVICGLDYAMTLPRPTVVNLSLGEGGRPGETACSSSALHVAICNATAQHVTVIAAAGNDGGDAASFAPAAFDEVTTVSAFTDFDGRRSFAGCRADFFEYGYQCDDTLADFSNHGSVVDVAAPGVWILSSWNDGAWRTSSGTSMAAPHVAGAAALVLGANPSLSPSQVREILRTTGECPDGAVANASTCAGHGQWDVGSLFGNHPDPDGIAEPLVNARRSAQAAGDVAPPPAPTDTEPPTVAVTSPSGGTVSGPVSIAAEAADEGSGVASVAFLVDGLVVATDTSAPWATTWNTTTVVNGAHTITARAVDVAGNAATSPPIAVDVENVSSQPTVHITRLFGYGQTGRHSWKTWVEVSVAGDAGQPVSGATVTFAVSGGATATRSCTTSANGTCSTSKSKVTVPNSATSVTYVTSNVAASGATWDGARWGVTLVRPTAKAIANQAGGRLG